MKLLIFGLILILTGTLFAGCASDAYGKACASCPFDSQGKMDQNCYGGYKASGITCTSTSYPIMSGKYAEGKCSAVDECTSELSSCTAQYQSGNDKTDCQEGSLSICFAAADSCMKSAAVKCGEIESPCATPAAGFVVLFGMLGFLKIRKN
ncbi:Uncharacterised protein [Candidatus Bilamarchaeum dharawalense]|uniref:Uncharacterized protein n=1 Tax=Candidatus Bilamarchaeum dharawalense TaxID=2885759 RepID=A0A5E4LX40_9ARCH|nr:Uncharacterised protein [Candidatus Bilamarchaeum dharawalense]